MLSPIGAQGFVLGRGNQPLSPAVVRAIGLDNIIVVATPAKLARPYPCTSGGLDVSKLARTIEDCNNLPFAVAGEHMEAIREGMEWSDAYIRPLREIAFPGD